MKWNTGYGDKYGLSGNSRLVIRITTDLKDLCALYIIAWVVLPILADHMIFRVMGLMCCGLFLILTCPYFRGAILKYVLLSGLLISTLFLIIWAGQGDLDLAASRTINVFIFVILGLFSLYYYQYERKKIKIFFFYTVALFLVVTVPSLIALQSNEFVMRNASGLTVRTGIERFAGSYGYAYGCVVLETILFYDMCHNKTKGWKRFVRIAALLLFGYVILNAGYTTAIILMLLGMIMALGVRKSGIGTIVLFGIVGIALIAIIPAVLEYIVGNFDIPLVYKQKLSILIDMTDSGSDVSYTDITRGQLLVQGLQAILKYPVFGSVLLAGEHAAGAHQTLIDVLANYGVLYAVLYYYVVYYTAIRQLKADPKLKMVVGLLLLVLGFVNTYDYTTFVIPFLVGPYIADKAENHSLKDATVR